MEHAETTSTRSKTKSTPSAINTHDAEIGVVAKKFTIMHELFVPTIASFFSREKPAEYDFWDAARYLNEESKLEGIIAEVYEVFPEHLHDFINGHSNFETLVSLKL